MEFIAANIKCNGCVNKIKIAFKKEAGVSNVIIDIPTGKVTCDYEGAKDNEYFSQILDTLGYPEKKKRNRFKIFGR